MGSIPRDPSIDSTVAFRADPYRFISRRCRELGTDVFETRLLLRKTICMSGAAATRVFYDPTRFRRAGGSPEALRMTLFAKGGVHGLDGDEHRHRKHMFMSMMTPESVRQLSQRALEQMRLRAARWPIASHVVLYADFQHILTRAAYSWLGIPIEEPGFAGRVRDLTLLFDPACHTLGGHARARLARKRSEQWARHVIRSARSQRLSVSDDLPLHVIAQHRQLNGELLPDRIAAIELLNLLRPIAAVSVYIVLAAHALHVHAETRVPAHDDDSGYLERFVLEVRRFYPFFPAIAAQVLMDFEWKGHTFQGAHRVLLDVYGTNHDERAWAEPETFDPERFRNWDRSAYNFISQGGGDHFRDHRCPGEWITVELMKTAVRFLTHEVTYDVPAQNLNIDFSELPALPKDHLVIQNAELIKTGLRRTTSSFAGRDTQPNA